MTMSDGMSTNSSEISSLNFYNAYVKRDNGIHHDKSDEEQDNDESDDSEKIESNKGVHKMFNIGDRIRVAHISNKRSCAISHYNTCPVTEEVSELVGMFGKITEITRMVNFNPEKVEYSFEMLPEVQLRVKLEQEYNNIFWKCFLSVDVINYTLLGESFGDQIFYETCDESFEWTKLCNEKNILVNDQMNHNFQSVNDAISLAKLETMVETFQEQAHEYYHRIFEYYYDLNRTLRIEAHKSFLISKNNEEYINSLD